MKLYLLKKTAEKFTSAAINSLSLYTTGTNQFLKKKDEIEKNMIKLLPPRLHQHLFNKQIECTSNPICSTHDFTEQIELPQLEVTNNLMEHFKKLGEKQFNGYI